MSSVCLNTWFLGLASPLCTESQCETCLYESICSVFLYSSFCFSMCVLTDLGWCALGGCCWTHCFQISSQVLLDDANDDSVTYSSPWSAIKTGHSFPIQTHGFLPCFFFFWLGTVYNQFLFCVFSMLHFFGKSLRANSWDDESTGSSPWQPLSLSFRHFSLAELT